MASNNTPDVRVRLSAEGVQEVVSAFRQIASESQSTARKTAESVSTLEKLKLGEWAMRAAEYVKEFGATSLETQEDINKLNKKTGMSVETLSTLMRVAKLADGDLGDLEKGFKKINTAIESLSVGDSSAKNIFSALGLQAKDFIGLNADQKFLKVATALGKITDEDQRARVAQELFGKASGTMILICDELANKGFANLSAETERLNQKFSKDTVEAAEEFNDALKSMELEAQALAGKGFIAIKQGLDEIIEKVRSASGKVANSGWLTALLPGLALLGKANGEGAKAAQEESAQNSYTTPGGMMSSHGSTALTGTPVASHSAADTQKYIAELNKYNAVQNAAARKQGAALAKIQAEAAKQGAEQVLALKQSQLAREQMLDDDSYSNGLTSIDDYYDARSKRINAGLAAEVQALQAKRAAQKKENAADVAALDGEIAKQKAVNGALADTKELEQQRTQTALSGQTKLKAIDNQIAQARAKSANDQTQNTINEGKAQQDLAKERVSLEQKIAEAQGDTYKSALIGIQQQAAELAKSLHTAVDDPQVQQLISLLTGKAKAENFAKQFQSSMSMYSVNTNAMDLYQSRLQNSVNAGTAWPSQAQAAYSKTVQEQLPTLQKQLDLLKQTAQTELDAATSAVNAAAAQGIDTTEKRDAVTAAMEHVQALEQEQQKLDSMSTAANFSAQQMAYLKTSLEDAAKSDLTSWLSSGIDDADNFGDAIRGLVLSFAQSMREIAAQILANMAIYALVNKFTKDKSGNLSDAAPKLITSSVMMMVGGKVVADASGKLQTASDSLIAGAFALMAANSMGGGSFYASGGPVIGPGTSTSDSIPAWLSDGEYVLRAAAVRRVGVSTLNAINRGASPAMLSRSSVPRFAEGGLVDFGGAGSGAPGNAGLTAALDIDHVLLLKRLEASPEFTRVLVRTVDGNSKKFNKALGK